MQSDLVVVVVAFAAIKATTAKTHTHTHWHMDKETNKQIPSKKPVEFTITTTANIARVSASMLFLTFFYFVRLLGAFAIEAWLTQIRKYTHMQAANPLASAISLVPSGLASERVFYITFLCA